MRYTSHFIVNNILEVSAILKTPAVPLLSELQFIQGMIWFWLPTSLVICNDIMAYVFGERYSPSPDLVSNQSVCRDDDGKDATYQVIAEENCGRLCRRFLQHTHCGSYSEFLDIPLLLTAESSTRE
jgi:hypothetical protein